MRSTIAAIAQGMTDALVARNVGLAVRILWMGFKLLCRQAIAMPQKLAIAFSVFIRNRFDAAFTGVCKSFVIIKAIGKAGKR